MIPTHKTNGSAGAFLVEQTMTKYEKYLRMMNLNKTRPLAEKMLRDMWENWLCEDEDDKKSFHAYGLGSHWRERQIEVMRELEIPELLRFRRGGDSRAKPIKFNEETRHLFATMQNQIVTKREYRFHNTNA